MMRSGSVTAEREPPNVEGMQEKADEEDGGGRWGGQAYS